ncbi:MAG: hypothetical protein LBE74_07520 [Treponema sp.]|jgi:hypothetical protein|nr:hypothetical protein [Treponema sp.]
MERKTLAIIPILLLFVSCSGTKIASFPFEYEGEGAVLFGNSKTAASGQISLIKEANFVYTFETSPHIPTDSSFEIDYTVQGGGAVVLTIEGDADPSAKGQKAAYSRQWRLPLDASLITDDAPPNLIRYAVPLTVSKIAKISLDVSKPDKDRKKDGSTLGVKAFRIRKRWFGFEWKDGVFSATPFVEKADATGVTQESWVIDPPIDYRIDGAVELWASAFPKEASGDDRIVVEPGTVSYEWTSPHDLKNALFLPPGALPYNPYPLRVAVSPQMGRIRLSASPVRSFPATPVPADPGIVLSYKKGDWRDPRYEVFQWEGFPSILIFDTADYAVQDKLFKRLAFFVEKAGYRGRLSTDRELAGQHGWNAHDYRAEDLAAFFELAETTSFPLSAEEEELKTILLENGILKRKSNQKIDAGAGAVVSLSRESSDYLRRQFMAHEGFHGVFFISEEFRDFSKDRYNRLSLAARNFILSFFDYQHYDISDSYLVINEFQAHVLQQSASQAGWYFGGNLAARLEASPWRRAILPKKDEASATWPEIASAFQTEANAFSAYVNKRWGLDAGRVWRVTVK